MKMITLPKLRDSLRDRVHEVKVPAEIADRARIPIERMVAISYGPQRQQVEAAIGGFARPPLSVARLRSNSGGV